MQHAVVSASSLLREKTKSCVLILSTFATGWVACSAAPVHICILGTVATASPAPLQLQAVRSSILASLVRARPHPMGSRMCMPSAVATWMPRTTGGCRCIVCTIAAACHAMACASPAQMHLHPVLGCCMGILLTVAAASCALLHAHPLESCRRSLLRGAMPYLYPMRRCTSMSCTNAAAFNAQRHLHPIRWCSHIPFGVTSVFRPQLQLHAVRVCVTCSGSCMCSLLSCARLFVHPHPIRVPAPWQSQVARSGICIPCARASTSCAHWHSHPVLVAARAVFSFS